MGLYLGKQSIIAINEKVATKQWVTDQRYLTNSDLSDYITNEQLQPVSDKIDDVSAKVEDISTKIIKKGTLGTINGKSIENGNNITIDLSLGGYYTKEQTDEKFLTKAEAGNLADYVKNGELDTKVGEAGYVKIAAVNAAIGTKIDGFKKIVMLTTAEYNSLVSSGTVDTNTVYMAYDA